MKLARLAGATSEIWQVFIRDSSSTTGAGLTGLAFNTGGLTAYYHRDTDTTATAITLATMTVGTFTSGGFKEIDATNMSGWYQFCPPNAALAAGAKSCGFLLKGAANMVPLPIEVDLAAGVALATTPPTAAAVATAVLTTAMTESYAALAAAPTLAQAVFGILQRLLENSISGTTVTVKKLDGSTTAFTQTLNSATAPTSSTRAT